MIRPSSRKPTSRLLEYSASLGLNSRRRYAEAALKASRREAEQAAKASRLEPPRPDEAGALTSEFLVSLSEELQAPLNSIIDLSGLLEDEVAIRDPDRVLGYGRDINATGRQLLNVINDLLDIARVEAGRVEMRDASIDLRRCIESCLNNVAGNAKRFGLDLRCQIDDSLPALRGDEVRVRQILMNLLSNAINHTPRGGRVMVSAAIGETGRMVLTVQDTGIGMNAEEAGKALALSEGTEGEIGRRFPGTRLGLQLSKALAELHGGSFSIDSAPDVGTRASVGFPATRVVPHPQQGTPHPEPLAAELHRQRA